MKTPIKALALALSLAAPWSLPSAGQALTLDRIVAVVEDQNFGDTTIKPDIITQSDVEALARPVIQRLQAQGTTVDPMRVRKKALDEVILQRLRDQKAKKLGVTVSEADIDAMVANVAAQNKLPVEQFPEALASQGISYENYRQEIRNKLMENRLINKVIRPMVTVTDEEIKDLHSNLNPTLAQEERRLAQVLLEVKPNDPPEETERKRQKLLWMLDELKNNRVQFNDLAVQFSDDTSSADGGDMGWFKRGELVADLERTVFALEEGEVSQLIRSAQGFHLLKLTEIRQAGHKSGSETTTKIRVKARHILLRLTPEATTEEVEAAHEKLADMREKISSGEETFAELAKKHSQDGSAAKGGDLGWFSSGVMVPPFEKAAFALEKGNMSDAVRSQFGLHLILVEDREESEMSAMEAMKPELEKRLIETKLKARYRQWLRDLRLRAYVEIR
ncbi:MAG: peptidylprolyl isomerase [Magnetococcales bacterium]|nr:peptidylprolyl isomerase [Magnetococcales bacterium]